MLVLSGSQEGGEEQINRRPNNFLKQYTHYTIVLFNFCRTHFWVTVLQVSEVKAFHVYYNSRCTHCNVKLKSIEPFNMESLNKIFYFCSPKHMSKFMNGVVKWNACHLSNTSNVSNHSCSGMSDLFSTFSFQELMLLQNFPFGIFHGKTSNRWLIFVC